MRENEWKDAYGTLGVQTSQLTQLPLHILDPWQGAAGEPQPFKAYTEDKLLELAENIEKNGIIEPICVRPKGSRFEIIAGHNRVEAARIAGLTTVPALVQQLDDDQAAILLVDSNLQHRETLLPSEKAWAYRTRLEAVKRKAGRPKNNSAQLEPNFRSNETVAEEVGQSRAQVQRYIRLTYLIQPFLDMVDAGKCKLNPGTELSYLQLTEQTLLYKIITENMEKPKGPSIKQAKALRQLSDTGSITEPAIMDILFPAEDDNKAKDLKISLFELRAFFPADTAPEIMKQAIFDALNEYTRTMSRTE